MKLLFRIRDLFTGPALLLLPLFGFEKFQRILYLWEVHIGTWILIGRWVGVGGIAINSGVQSHISRQFEYVTSRHLLMILTTKENYLLINNEKWKIINECLEFILKTQSSKKTMIGNYRSAIPYIADDFIYSSSPSIYNTSNQRKAIWSNFDDSNLTLKTRRKH